MFLFKKLRAEAYFRNAVIHCNLRSIYMNQGKLYARGNSYDKTFKNGNDLANWLNKEKAKYLGIDDR